MIGSLNGSSDKNLGNTGLFVPYILISSNSDLRLFTHTITMIASSGRQFFPTKVRAYNASIMQCHAAISHRSFYATLHKPAGPLFSSALCRASAAFDHEQHPKPCTDVHIGSRICSLPFTLQSRPIDRHGKLETPRLGSSDLANSDLTLRQCAVVFKAACHCNYRCDKMRVKCSFQSGCPCFTSISNRFFFSRSHLRSFPLASEIYFLE